MHVKLLILCAMTNCHQAYCFYRVW